MTLSARLLLLVFSAALLAFGFAKPAHAVSLKTESEVNGPAVRLSDVFDGISADLDRDIARAPAPGKSVTYDAIVLSRVAQMYSLDWKPQSVSDHTTIIAAAHKVTADDIRPAVVAKLKDQDIKGDIEVTFDNRSLEINLPANRDPNFSLNNFGYDTINHRFHADLVAETDYGPTSMPLSGRVTVEHRIPVLVKRLEAGSIISEADLDWTTVSDDHMEGVLAANDQLIGRELRRDTDGNIPLRDRDVMPPRLVVRGSLVTMKIETPMMSVTAQGKALQDGKLGDVVRVTNTQSNRVIEGTVAGPGIVSIPLTQKFAAVTGGQE